MLIKFLSWPKFLLVTTCTLVVVKHSMTKKREKLESSHNNEFFYKIKVLMAQKCQLDFNCHLNDKDFRSRKIVVIEKCWLNFDHPM
jgi:hypothetical protein